MLKIKSKIFLSLTLFKYSTIYFKKSIIFHFKFLDFIFRCIDSVYSTLETIPKDDNDDYTSLRAKSKDENNAHANFGYEVNKNNNLNVASLNTITKWLDAIDMEKYTDNFLEKEYAKTSQILSFTIDDLEELGITLIEDREQIYEAIQDTKSQV